MKEISYDGERSKIKIERDINSPDCFAHGQPASGTPSREAEVYQMTA